MGIPLTPGPRSARGASKTSAERKLVTVMLCDVDESVEDFAERDPEDVDLMLARHLDRISEEVEAYGGEVEHVVGGRILATFGVPKTRDDDPERAVRAALAIRDALTARGASTRGVRLHIAIATGEALVRHDAARRRSGGQRVLGDLVTTCAHLQEATPTGAIMVTDATMRATERAISYGPASIVALRNGEPVTVWSALEPRAKLPPGMRPRRLPPLVGRMRELGALLERFAFARAGGSPQLVVLTGPPGIGKSRLLVEFARVAEAGVDPAVFRHGRSLAYNDGMRALSEIVETEAGILETDSADEAERKLEWAVFNAIDDPATAVWVNRHLRRLLGTSAEGQLGAGDREEMLVAWRHYLYGRAQREPLVLAMEDLHWADDILLDFLESVVDPEVAVKAGQVPLVLVAAARPELLERRPSWLRGRPGITVVPVDPLSQADTARLVSALLSHHGLDLGAGAPTASPDPALLARIGGNPLFAEEYVRMLRDRGGTVTLDDPGQLLVEGGRVAVVSAPGRAAAPPPMPTTVHAIIAARLDALPPDEKALIHDAAVIGHVGWVGALAKVGGGEPDADRETVETLLTRLERKDFLVRSERSRVAGETEYRFQHLLVRDVAYGQILRAERAAKHQRAAAWIEAIVSDRAAEHAELLAHHYHQAYQLYRAAGVEVEGLAAKAMRASRDAGDRVAALGIYTGATRYYTEALALCPGADPARGDLLLRLGRARVAGEGAGEEALREAHALLLEQGDRVGAAEAEMLLAELAFLHGRGEERAGHVSQALALIADAPPSPGKATVLKGCMLHLVIANRHAEALQVAQQVLAMARGLGLRDLEGSALGTIGLARVDAGDPEGIVDLQEAITTFEVLGTPGSIIWHLNLAYARAILGDLPGHAAALREGTAEAERFGALRWLRAARLHRVAEHYWNGEWDEAAAIVDALTAEPRVEGQARHYLEWECLLWRGRIRLARGQVAAALEDAEAAYTLAAEVADPQALNPTRCFLARALLAAGHEDEARELADGLLESLRGSLLSPELGVDLGVVLASLDLTPEGAPPDLEALDIPRSRWRDAVEAFLRGDAARAADIYATIGSKPDEAHARLEAARALLSTAGRSTPEGEDQLNSALAFYRQVAANAYLVEAEALESALVREP
jgi:class 3 adenylate cyclase/predicted transcriptional regulator